MALRPRNEKQNKFSFQHFSIVLWFSWCLPTSLNDHFVRNFHTKLLAFFMLMLKSTNLPVSSWTIAFRLLLTYLDVLYEVSIYPCLHQFQKEVKDAQHFTGNALYIPNNMSRCFNVIYLYFHIYQNLEGQIKPFWGGGEVSVL